MLIRGFAERGDMVEARRWFDATSPGMRTVVTWTVAVHGYVSAGNMEAAREVLDRMHAREERFRVVVHGHGVLQCWRRRSAQDDVSVIVVLNVSAAANG